MSLASDLMSGGSFTIAARDVDDFTVSGTKRPGAYGPAGAVRGGRLQFAFVTPADRGAPFMETNVYFKGRTYNTTQRLSHLQQLREGKLVLQFYPSGRARNAVATLTPEANARFQVFLDKQEETGHLNID